MAQDSYGEDLTDVAVVEMVGYDGAHAGSVLYAQLCHQTQGQAHSFLSGYTGGGNDLQRRHAAYRMSQHAFSRGL